MQLRVCILDFLCTTYSQLLCVKAHKQTTTTTHHALRMQLCLCNCIIGVWKLCRMRNNCCIVACSAMWRVRSSTTAPYATRM